MKPFPITLTTNDIRTGAIENDCDGLLYMVKFDIQQLKASRRLRWDNDVALYWVYKNQNFTFMIVAPRGLIKEYELVVWNESGNIHLGSWQFLDSAIPSNVLNEIDDVCEHFLNGEVKCGQCGTWVDYKKAPSYFAGVYCQTCWEGGWKEKEARETYE